MGLRPLTKEEFVERAIQVHGNKYDYSNVKYKNSRIKVCIICPTHGEFWKEPKEHYRGSGCKKCADDYKRGNVENFVRKSREVHGNKYDYSKVEYISNKVKVCIVCHKHGEFWQRPDKHIFSVRGCSKCGGSDVLSKKEFVEKSKRVHGNKYDYSRIEYKNGLTKVCIVCHKHGEFWQRPSSHLQGNGCPICKYSKGERKISLWLKSRKVKFITQKVFEECRDKRSLPFDFYLPELNMCIEFDGLQHFKPMGFRKSSNIFSKTVAHDKIKNDFCEDKGIKLLRIRYYENVEKILEKFIK